MKTALKALMYTAGGALALSGACAFLVAPGKRDKEQRAPFMGRNYAHRGLHKIDKSIPENSLPAFEAAARIGYGVELDVHLTLDDELVVFHDDDLKRICGVEGKVEEKSFDPRIVLWFRVHAPEVLRGQLSTRMSSLKKSTNRVQAFILSRLFTNFLTRPQFIAYEIGRKPLTVKLCEFLGAMKVAWTSREWKTEEKNDAVIFQFYRPRVKYK